MSLIEDHYAFRDGMLADLRRDLVGPSDPEEILHDAPLTAYLAGILHPRSRQPRSRRPRIDGTVDAEAADAAAAGTAVPLDARVSASDEEPSSAESTTPLSAVRYPSSLAMTFSVDTHRTDSVDVAITAAQYVPLGDDGTVLAEHEIATRERTDLLSGSWQRVPRTFSPIRLRIQESGAERTDLGGLQLYWKTRISPSDGTASVTLALINTLDADGPVRDLRAWFQCGLSVTSPDGDVFVEREMAGTRGVADDDLASYRLLFRHARSFAVGHGCSAVWEPADGERAREVRTESIPAARVRVAVSNDAIENDALSLASATDMTRHELVAALERFADDYATWIRNQQTEAGSLEGELRTTADTHVARCRRAAERMRSSCQILAEDDDAFRAFRLMTEAMLMQRSRTDWRRNGAVGKVTIDRQAEWRPFQLAFVLLCLEGIADPSHEDRDIADLLWFPTGGGKTEAYLGLIAFTIFLRRLRGEGHAGVAVLMRYTLRTLTIQQFARAALLICCCEELRRRDDVLGDEEISIGLWVGRAGTPNSHDDLSKSLRQLEDKKSPTRGDPRQLTECPWCGRKLEVGHHRQDPSTGRLIIGCANDDCEFGERLPVFVVDEDLYDARPSLLIATADKFAMMAWKPECGALFNLGSGDPPPELIVQDELHLISGPLGTLAGLYETAVDILCEHQGRRPKVIASTATIRRAGEQSSALFDRAMEQFPPPALDARDSYFSIEAPPEKRGDRMYVGVLAPGASHAMLMIRTYARLLRSGASGDVSDEVRDPYWTLLGYFNSLRVLGGARMQVQDDVVDHIRRLSDDEDVRAVAENLVEMTSRVKSSDIPENLASLERTFPNAVDVVLATNMISVGVDIDRLGLMAVMGQPQSTSEYIQATSRVGRSHPGLVAVIANGARSRDRSHYEGFAGYHAALYRQVESTSVTPFSSRARDRGLHAVLVAVARLTVDGLRSNESAGRVGEYTEDIERIRRRIVERASKIVGDEATETDEQLRSVIRIWHSRARDVPQLHYQDREHPERALLVDAAIGNSYDGFPTLFSLRDVDAQTPLKLVRQRA